MTVRMKVTTKNSARAVLTTALWLCSAAGCRTIPSEFVCMKDSECTLGGAPGVCQPDKHCSQSDSTCIPSGYRYRAAGALDGQCVGAVADGGDLPSMACPAFALLCDGYETGDFFKTSGTDTNDGAAMLVVDQQIVHSGHYALHVTVPTQSVPKAGAAQYRFTSPVPKTIAARAYVSDVVGGPSLFYNAFAAFFNSANGNQYITAGVDTNGNWVTSEPAKDHNGTPASVKLNSWYCVELVYDFPASGAGHIQMFIDGVSVVDSPTNDPSPGYDTFEVGIFRSHPSGDERRIDDVVLADRRVGCQ
jgi:hypothetical protein